MRIIKKLKNKNKLSLGFSLVELLVTISILFLVSGFVFFNHSQFNNHVLIENLAYEISLVIRQAQSYGVQVKQTDGSFDEAYGVYFDVNSDEFRIFADKDSNFVYSAEDTTIDVLKMTNRNQLNDLCVGGTCGISSISISFLRPNPEAIIKVNAGDSGYDTAEIKIISPKGLVKEIFVNRVGQISVQTAEAGLPTPPANPNPVCSVGASPSTITQGDSSTLTWSSSDANSGSVTGIGDVSPVGGGSVSVSPSSTTFYEGTFAGTGGTTYCDTTITVIAAPPSAPTCDMSASPSTIDEGDNSTLTWTSTDATSVSIDNGVSSTNPNSSENVSPNSTTTYTGTFVGEDGSTIECDVYVKVSVDIW